MVDLTTVVVQKAVAQKTISNLSKHLLFCRLSPGDKRVTGSVRSMEASQDWGRSTCTVVHFQVHRKYISSTRLHLLYNDLSTVLPVPSL